MKRFSLLLVLALVCASGKEPVQWKTATVLHAQYKTESSIGYVSGLSQSARGEFDFEADGTIYVASEWVAPQTRLDLKEGDTVQLAIEKKTLLLRIDDKKIRKLKLRHVHPKKWDQ